MIPRSEWKWFGVAAHFCGGSDCRFHLSTVVGDCIISTVGDYHPRLRPGGEAVDIGCDRKYETMVFRAGEACVDPGCNCGMPAAIVEGGELGFDGYNTAGAATVGHMAMCNEWAEKVKS